MKYNQPHGISDPNAIYINGNPQTGTMGSIPPAAAIEYPQREIVKVITAAGYGPANTDLQQLARAIQSNQLIYSDDFGSVNNVAVVMDPVVSSNFVKGLTVVTKIAVTNTGPSNLYLDGVGPWEIVPAADPTGHLSARDLNQGQMVALCFDGAKFQLVWSSRQPGSPVFLSVPQYYWVDAVNGSDAYDGQSATFTSGIRGPFRTLQHAANQIPLFNLNGHYIYFTVLSGTYEGFVIPKCNGSGLIYFHGNPANPALCHIHGTNRTAVIAGNVGCAVYFDGFKLSATPEAPPHASDSISGIVTAGDDTIGVLGAMEFGPCGGAHISAQRGGRASNLAAGCAWKITGGCTGNQFIPGCHVHCYVQGDFSCNVLGGPTVTIANPVTFNGAYAYAINNSWLEYPVPGLTFINTPTPFAVTGYKYQVHGNSSINSGSSGNANYFPGSAAGYATLGGYYS